MAQGCWTPNVSLPGSFRGKLQIVFSVTAYEFVPRNMFLDLPLQVLAGSQCVNVPRLFFSAKQVNLNHFEQGDKLTRSPTLP